MYIFVFEVYYFVPSLFCKNVDEYDHYNIQWYKYIYWMEHVSDGTNNLYGTVYCWHVIKYHIMFCLQ